MSKERKEINKEKLKALEVTLGKIEKDFGKAAGLLKFMALRHQEKQHLPFMQLPKRKKTVELLQL
jgi:hypothetical protein